MQLQPIVKQTIALLSGNIYVPAFSAGGYGAANKSFVAQQLSALMTAIMQQRNANTSQQVTLAVDPIATCIMGLKGLAVSQGDLSAKPPKPPLLCQVTPRGCF